MRMSVRVGAGASLALLAWWLASGGWWEIAVLVLLGAGLGAVAARPPKPPKFVPDSWRKAGK